MEELCILAKILTWMHIANGGKKWRQGRGGNVEDKGKEEFWEIA